MTNSCSGGGGGGGDATEHVAGATGSTSLNHCIKRLGCNQRRVYTYWMCEIEFILRAWLRFDGGVRDRSCYLMLMDCKHTSLLITIYILKSCIEYYYN